MNDDDRVPTNELRTESRTVALGAANNVRVNLEMKAGELKIAGGAPHLPDANFTYNAPRWKPVVMYELSGEVANLEVKQPESGRALSDTRYEWDLHLSNEVPIRMTVNMGVGRATMTLGGLSLSHLELNIRAGETALDLTGNWKSDLSVQIRGVGRATIRLPRDVGARVMAQGNMGAINAGGFRRQGDAYVNDLYGKAPVTLNVEMEGGMGEINLELGGESPAAHLFSRVFRRPQGVFLAFRPE
jgi:hypothetical protein